jgi:hypothetical protein
MASSIREQMANIHPQFEISVVDGDVLSVALSREGILSASVSSPLTS